MAIDVVLYRLNSYKKSNIMLKFDLKMSNFQILNLNPYFPLRPYAHEVSIYRAVASKNEKK